jgi:hypothetical protein
MVYKLPPIHVRHFRDPDMITGDKGKRSCLEPSVARVVSFSPDPARDGLPAETLLLIDIINAEGLVIIQTVWATTPDRRRGHRLTRFEHVADQTALTQRLGELTPALWPTREAIAAARVAIARP